MKAKKTKDPYTESLRYVENARQLLAKAGMEDAEHYCDGKYIRLAGHALYSGMLLSADEIFRRAGLPTLPEGIRKSREYYMYHAQQIDEALAVRFPNDIKLRLDLRDAYRYSHLYMAYDGDGSTATVENAFKFVMRIIARIAPQAMQQIPRIDNPRQFPVRNIVRR